MASQQEQPYEKVLDSYRKLYPTYEILTNKILEIISAILKECMFKREYFLQGRTKAIYSFADKISRKKYSDPIREITDFSGVRIILINLEKKDLMCDLIRKYFKIELKDNEGKLDKLYPQEFGYPYTYFIIQLLPEKFYKKTFRIVIPKEIGQLKAEIQVGTFLEHAWAINQQNMLYKNEFDLPRPYKRQISRVTALLEIADKSMNNLVKKIYNYESSYGSYMSSEDIEREIKRLQLIYKGNKESIDLGHKIAKFAMEIDDWDNAINILDAIYNSSLFLDSPCFKRALILKDLGIAKCQKYKPEKNRPLFDEGQKNIFDSIKIYDKDSDAYAAAGGTYKKLGMDYEAYTWYKKALEINPNDPYPLVNYLVYELLNNQDMVPILDYHKSIIQKAIKKRSDQINVLVDIPWANFDVGTLSLFLGNLNLSLHNYLMAIRLSQHEWMIGTTLNTLNKLQKFSNRLSGFNLVRTQLLLGMKFHRKDEENKDQELNAAIDLQLKNDSILRINRDDLQEPIVIIAGGTDESVEQEIQRYKKILIEAFKNFKCTIISGGTTSGISGLAGDIKEAYGNKIRLIGYTPRKIPQESAIKLDDRYEHRFSNAEDFSYLEVLQYWYDILRSRCDPNKVKLIGINGGRISALEFRTAITFGGQVGILGGSGRAATDLINDSWWTETIERANKNRPKKLFKVIKNTSEDISKFLKRPFITDPEIENLRKLLIQHTDGASLYEKNFSPIKMPGDLMSGLLSATQSFSKEIGFGEVPLLSAKQGTITMNPFSTGDYRIFFFLFEKPSVSLEKKISDFTYICEKELGEEFIALQQIKVYKNEKKMAGILSSVFGPEILKFYEEI